MSSPLGSVSESVSGRSLRHSIAHSFSYLEPSDLVSGLPSSQTVPLSLSSGPFGAASPTARSVDQPGAVSFIGGDEGAARFQQLSRSRATANSKIDAVHTRELERPIIVPLSLQDATGNRLELGGYAAMPRLKPPPRIPRDHCHSQTSAEPVARRSLAAPSGGNSAKRYSWDCRASVVANGAANGDADGSGMSTLPKPKKPVLNCSDYTIGGAEKPSSMVILTTDGGVSPSTATTISVSSNGGIESQLETSYCDNDSDSSTAELKLSFSDDECFVDVPVSKTAKKS